MQIAAYRENSYNRRRINFPEHFYRNPENVNSYSSHVYFDFMRFSILVTVITEFKKQ